MTKIGTTDRTLTGFPFSVVDVSNGDRLGRCALWVILSIGMAKVRPILPRNVATIVNPLSILGLIHSFVSEKRDPFISSVSIASLLLQIAIPSIRSIREGSVRQLLFSNENHFIKDTLLVEELSKEGLPTLCATRMVCTLQHLVVDETKVIEFYLIPIDADTQVVIADKQLTATQPTWTICLDEKDQSALNPHLSKLIHYTQCNLIGSCQVVDPTVNVHFTSCLQNMSKVQLVAKERPRAIIPTTVHVGSSAPSAFRKLT